MFYDAITNNHGLAHDPFQAVVAPRPIGWISTLSNAGVVNLAPYSFFNAVGTDPHYVMFASGGRKDSQTNAEETGEFVCSLATADLMDEMKKTSMPVPPHVDEMAMAGLNPTPSQLVKPPRIKESPVAFECRYYKTVTLPGKDDTSGGFSIVIGQVVGIYIADHVLRDGMVDVSRLKPLARMGYQDYAVVDQVFKIQNTSSNERR